MFRKNNNVYTINIWYRRVRELNLRTGDHLVAVYWMAACCMRRMQPTRRDPFVKRVTQIARSVFLATHLWIFTDKSHSVYVCACVCVKCNLKFWLML